MVPQFASLLRQRRELDRDGDGDDDDQDVSEAAAELLVLENANFDTDDEAEYDWVDDYSKTKELSFFAGLGMTQFRAAQFALVRQGCVGLEDAYVGDTDGGLNPKEYVDYYYCAEPFASARGGNFTELLRESVLTEFVYREFPSSDGFDELATSCLRDFGEGVFDKLVDLARDARHGYFPITSPFSPRATTVEASVDSRASASIGAPRERIAMATSTAGLCAAVRRALGDDRLVQHWSVETDSGASAFVLFRAEADALHVALVKNDGYARRRRRGARGDADTLPFEYDDDGGADGFAADLAAALRARPRLELAAPDDPVRLELRFEDGGTVLTAGFPLARNTSNLYDDLVSHFEPRAPGGGGGDDAPAAAPTGGKRGGFQPSRFVVKEKKKKPRRRVCHTSGA
ncbi:hypothetical protein JL721_5110 [Aureococcus anophagefferens]|nr:hypothetical protein JL721_5110 [Aureococcus anophagefferens]